tara:strand:- start:18485 stop:18724 length:240 start_codon:yes stop_codon:yes gene_type:complete
MSDVKKAFETLKAATPKDFRTVQEELRNLINTKQKEWVDWRNKASKEWLETIEVDEEWVAGERFGGGDWWKMNEYRRMK